MLDPLPAPSSRLSSSIESIAHRLSFPTLPLHLHQIITSYLFYQFIQTVISPRLSAYLFPSIYPRFNRRTKINWDVHVVSLVQSCSINAVALWVMWVDEERRAMNSTGRVYGYTGACGMIQGLAAGYFLWDLVVTSRNVAIFGMGMWAHAVCALCVFSFGFRPFLNFYGPTFILYELSSPFLNIHWFLDKVHLTGSKYQWYNGILLLATFFGCRLVWGTYQSIRVYQDVWAALHLPVDSSGHLLEEIFQGNVTNSIADNLLVPPGGGLCLGRAECVAAQNEIVRFVGPKTDAVPVWLAVTYLSSNIVLNSLNFYWFGKMIETVRKRFDGAKGAAPPQKGVQLANVVPLSSSSSSSVAHASGTDTKNKVVNNNEVKGGKSGRGRRRRTDSIILDVADGLERDERLGMMPDTPGSPAPTPTTTTTATTTTTTSPSQLEDRQPSSFSQPNTNGPIAVK